MGAKTCPDGLTARQRSEKRLQVKRISGAQALGQEPARGLGEEQQGQCNYKRKRESKIEDEARKGGRGHVSAGLTGLGSMAQALELK